MNTKASKNEEIETIQTVELDDVTGGCAACGCGNPGTQNPGTQNRAAMSPFQLSAFNRR